MSEVAGIYILLVILFGLGSMPLMHLLRNPKGDLFEPIYWASAYFLFIFGIRSIYALHFATPFLGAPPFSSETLKAWIVALLLVIVSFVTFLIGYYSKLGVAIAKVFPPLPQRWSLTKVRLLIPILLGISFLAFSKLVNIFGGWKIFLLMERQTILTAAGTSYLVHFVRLTSYALFVAYIAALIYGKLRFAVIFLLSLVLVMGITFGSKALVFSPLLSLLIIRHYLKANLNLRHLVILSILVVLSIPFFNIYRHSSNPGYILSKGMNVLLTDPNLLMSQLMHRFHGMDSLIFIVRDTPDVMDFQLGKTIVPLFVSWIPRAIWPGKPIISFGKIFGETYYAHWFAGTGTAPSPTIIGEAYLNFHICGVLWIGLISGVMLRTFYHYLIKRSYGPSGVFVFAVTSQFLLGGFWEADIVGLITRAGFSLLIAVIIVYLLAGKTR